MIADINEQRNRAQALALAKEQQQHVETIQNMGILVAILQHGKEIREGSAKGDAIVEQAERLVLKWINGFTEEEQK